MKPDEEILGQPGTLGWLRAKIDTLEAEVKAVRLDVIVIRTKLDVSEGGHLANRRALGWMIGAAAAAGAIADALLNWWRSLR
jgi:hypothetical protein